MVQSSDNQQPSTSATVEMPNNVLNQYEYQGELGRGAYGCVYKGVHMQTGKEYAIKKTRIDNKNDGIPATTIREIAILMDL